MKPPKLKPCPFCGEPGQLDERHPYKVYCTSPFCCFGPEEGTKHEAIRAWNKRAKARAK